MFRFTTFKVGFFCASYLLTSCVLQSSDFSGWKLAKGKESVAVAKENFLEISYDSPKRAVQVFRPDALIPLSQNVSRIRFWFASLEGDFDLSLLVTDASGKEHEVKVETNRYYSSWTHPKEVLQTFSRWYIGDSSSLTPSAPLEERVQKEFLEQTRSLLWPMPYSLSGISIKPTSKERNKLADPKAVISGKGKLCLGSWEALTFDGLSASSNWYLEERARWGWNSHPRIFPDDLCQTSGTKRYLVEMRQGFQGPVIWRKEGKMEVKTGDAFSLFNHSLELPVPPRGRYFLDCKVWKEDGALESTRWMQLYVFKSPEKNVSKISPDIEWRSAKKNHVFGPDSSTAKLSLYLDKTLLKTLGVDGKCEIVIRDWQENPLLQTSSVLKENIEVEFAEGRPGHAYVAYAKVYSGGKIVESSQLMFGMANVPEKARPVPDSVPDRDELMKNKVTLVAEHWGEYFQHYGPNTPLSGYGLPCTPERITLFDTWMKSLPQSDISIVAFYFGQSMVEPLPGVIFWDELDRRVELAKQLGLKVILTPTCPNSNPYRAAIWSDAMPTLDQYGYPIFDTAGRLTWPGMWSIGESYFPYLQKLAAHFSGNAAVVGYNLEKFCPRDRESSETRAELRVADYSDEAQREYEKWCKERGKKVAPLSKRFSLPGVDTLPEEVGPDLSDAWQSTMGFRMEAGCEWVNRSIEAIRSADYKRVVMVYQMGTLANAVPVLKKSGATLLPEGGPTYNELYMASMFAQAGLPYPNEPSTFVPRTPSHFDSAYFYSSCFADEAFWKFRWNQEALTSLPAYSSTRATLDFLKNSIPAYCQWFEAERIEPEVLVLGSHIDNVLATPRRLALTSLAGFDEFVALYQFHQIPTHFANEYSDWVDYSKFKLIFVSGGVFRQEVIAKLATYLKQGGKIVLVGQAGKFTPENPSLRDGLKEKLGLSSGIRTISSPAVPVPPAYVASHGHVKEMFDEKELESILSWAGISRNISIDEPGFDVLLRKGKKGVYEAAIFRRLLNGDIPGTVLPEKLTGTANCTVTLNHLLGAKYRVERFHRQKESLGSFKTSEQKLTLKLSNLEPGELVLLKVVPTE